MTESKPKPNSRMPPATRPEMIAPSASIEFQAIVKYSRRIPRLTMAWHELMPAFLLVW